MDGAGIIHFSGRLDQQIKHLGYRIELGAIEAAANSLSNVQHCAAVYDESHKTICLLVAAENVSEPDQLRRALVELLPRYMVPRRIEVVEGMPLNRNRKIDRQAVRFRFIPSETAEGQ
jgi:acyl-coenzyme A synthetase/AMP-(fatty) acid ligase